MFIKGLFFIKSDTIRMDIFRSYMVYSISFQAFDYLFIRAQIDRNIDREIDRLKTGKYKEIFFSILWNFFDYLFPYINFYT